MHKKGVFLYSLFFYLICYHYTPTWGQSAQVKLHELLYSATKLKEWNIADAALLQTFYAMHGEELIWTNNQPLQETGLKLIESAGAYGLEKANYHYQEITSLVNGQIISKSTVDSIQTDIIFSDALLNLVCDIYFGHTPKLNYNGLKSTPDKIRISVLVKSLLAAADKEKFLMQLEPTMKPYLEMKNLFRKLNEVVAIPSYEEEAINSKSVSLNNGPLRTKLVQWSFLDTTGAVTEKELTAALKKAQHFFDLVPDGKLNVYTVNALNTPLAKRIVAIKVAMNDLRWLQRFLYDSIVVINLPSASLCVYGLNNLIHESRLVVGKKRTPTPTLSSYIEEVILYPYWTVPHSIATKELLLKIKHNQSYLASNNFQVMNKQGKVLDPATIDWASLSATNFPYVIRQSTGCDNSLGIVKFNFYNPYSVYLHDTPSKGLFALSKRYFSHGCMRIENPIDLAELLLQEEKSTVQRLTEKCLQNQKPMVFKLNNPMPIVVLYNTVWYNTKGEVRFFDDVYGY